MDFSDFDRGQHFQELWESVRIERPVNYSLFTFGESDLPSFLVCGATEKGATVSITRGEVKVTRPAIITPDNARADRAQALGQYRAALSLGGSKPLPQLWEAAGLNFDFTEATLRPLIEMVEAELAALPEE